MIYEPLNQEIANRIIGHISDYFKTNEILTVNCISDKDWFKKESPLNFAVVIARLTEIKALEMKFKIKNKDKLYNQASELLNDPNVNDTDETQVVWIRGNKND